MSATTNLSVFKQKHNADIIIKNAHILTMDSKLNQYENGSVVIKDDKIIAIGNYKELENKYNAPKIVDGINKLVMPGLINTHSHAAMTIFRGYADDMPLEEWLYDNIFPIEQKFVTAENVILGSKLAITEMLRSGTTTFNDMYYFMDETAKIVDQTGIRAIISKGLIGFPAPNNSTSDEGIKKTLKLINKWESHPRITIAVAAHSTYSCSPELIINAKKMADKHNTPFNIHLAETKKEFESIKEMHKCTPVGLLHNLGILSDNVIAAHCVHLTPEDIQLIAENKVGVSHNPQSNMKIASGVAPIPKLIEAGAKVGIGTDGPASNNDLDMFDEVRTTALIHKLNNNDPSIINAKTITKLATIDGAKVLGLDDKTGSLEIGKKADIIILDLKKPHAHPLYNMYSLIVYNLKSSDVETVIIDGNIIMENYTFSNIQENELYEKINSLAAEIKKTTIKTGNNHYLNSKKI